MSPARKRTKFIFITYLCDAVALVLSLVAAYALRFHANLINVRGDKPDVIAYAQSMLVVIPVYLAFFRSYGLYQTARYIRRIEEMFLVAKAATFAVIALMAVTFFYRAFSYSRLVLVFLWFCSILFLTLERYYLIQWEYHRKRQKKEIARVLVVGANRNTRSIVQWAQYNPHYGRQIIGVLSKDPDLIGKHFEGAEIIGPAEECEKWIDSLKPDEVIICETSFDRDRLADLVSLCEDRFIEVRIGADFYGLLSQNVAVEYISTVPLLGFRPLPLDDPWNRFLKRTCDLVVASAMIVATLPVWGVVIILIKMDRGPILYKQERMGRDQKIFKVYKFRTMRVDAERETGPVWAKQEDARRTPAGNFLRRWNIDELPQLLNVLKGDMTLVGPRPERPHFIGKFRESIPRYMARHKVKCGLTGWAQVNGYRGNTSIQERIKYDLYYMENWSLLFDLEIMVMTLFAFKNAY